MWERLRKGHIVGIIDSHGVVHSEFTGPSIKFHTDFWPNQHHCHWRWCHSRSLWWCSQEHKPKDEQFDDIRSHLTRKFGIKWQENGYHDIDFLQSKWKK